MFFFVVTPVTPKSAPADDIMIENLDLESLLSKNRPNIEEDTEVSFQVKDIGLVRTSASTYLSTWI